MSAVREGAFDLGSWKQAFSNFGTTQDPVLPASGVTLTGGVSAGELPEGTPELAIDQLRFEWHRFLEHLSKKGLQVLVSHLQVSELLACTPQGLVDLGCCRKFSFEELLHDGELLEQEMASFYRRPMKIRIRYDAERDACTREKSVFTMFQELSEQNEVVRFLITEFGGELVY